MWTLEYKNYQMYLTLPVSDKYKTDDYNVIYFRTKLGAKRFLTKYKSKEPLFVTKYKPTIDTLI